MNKRDFMVWAAISVIAVLLVISAARAIHGVAFRESASCADRGGVLVRGWDGYVCLDKAAIR